jgi:peptidoglycan/xylan/chitin deacetylase (PgdA/CDA1 family)
MPRTDPNAPMPPRDPGPPARNRREAYRPILWGLTALMIVGLLVSACLPASPTSGAPEPVPPPVTPAPPPVTPAPPPSDPTPATPPPPPVTPPPEQSPPAPLPDRPADEPSQLVVHGDRRCAMIALTYDAGSGADGAAAILDTLKKHGVTSTFFLTGKWVEKYPDLAKRIAAEGHEIGNHSYSHPDLTKLQEAEAIQQIQDAEAAIQQITGKSSRPLFREPYGAQSEQERRWVRKAGYSYSIYWDVDTLDWQFPPVETLVKRLTERTQNGSIVLMHLNVPATATASDQAIPILRSKGYQLVTVSQLLQCEGQ